MLTWKGEWEIGLDGKLVEKDQELLTKAAVGVADALIAGMESSENKGTDKAVVACKACVAMFDLWRAAMFPKLSSTYMKELLEIAEARKIALGDT